MALTEITICDMALSRIGINLRIAAADATGEIADSTDDTPEQQACELHYERCRNRVLEMAPWPFARKYAFLTLIETGDPATDPWANKWRRSFVFPSDALILRGFVTTIPPFTPTEEPYEIAALAADAPDPATKIIYSDVAEADALMEYRLLVTEPTVFSDAFASTVAWLLASEIAMGLKADEVKRDRALRMFTVEISLAARLALNEETRRAPADGEFMASRGGY